MLRVAIIGLDGLVPELAFDQFLPQLPNLRALLEQGAWGPLASVDPPITVPAWSCLTSGFTPSQLGLYGFRHRRVGAYDQPYFATAEHVREPRLWDRLGAAGLSSGLLGVPQTWPVAPMKGWCALDFLTPARAPNRCWPLELESELRAVAGAPRADVEKLRSGDLGRILEEIHAISAQRFEQLRHLLVARPVDFAMLVDLAPDRAHHAFWRLFDPTHPRHEESPYSGAILEVYRRIDEQLGQTLAMLPPDCHVFVVSDHGARAMEGGFFINDWLRQEGLLTLKNRPSGPRAFDERLVDWSATQAWAWGGYYARIFVNLAGREPHGTVAAEDCDRLLDTLSVKLAGLHGVDGSPMNNRVLRPRDGKGDRPDLMVYFDDLRYRALASVGNPRLSTLTNDTGPDDANHSFHGVFAWRGPQVRPGPREGLRLIDVAPTVLSIFGLEATPGAEGRAIAR